MRQSFHLCLFVALVCTWFSSPVHRTFAQSGSSLGIQAFLEQHPGVLKEYRVAEGSAAEVIGTAALYFGVSPQLLLALIETNSQLISAPNPSTAQLEQPISNAGPSGLYAQISWAARELRAGLGPYEGEPFARFADGSRLPISSAQPPEGIAVQRLLAQGRTPAEWLVASAEFNRIFVLLFDNQLILPGTLAPDAPIAAPNSEFRLSAPWPLGITVRHLAWFDHAYPTVDSGDDGNTVVITYRGQENVQYDGHDGHDYVFPDAPFATPILAAAAGTAYIFDNYGGKVVVIVHPSGYETVYAHLGDWAPKLRSLIGTTNGVAVARGEEIGTSGASGIRAGGTPHLHFEVRVRSGGLLKQIDPYGWYGPGPDPCPQYQGCAVSTWLWDESLRGQYDFTPPNSPPPPPPPTDINPPVATLALNPPPDVRLFVDFETEALQTIGAGVPSGTPQIVAGYRGNGAIDLASSSVSYPTAGNLNLSAGTISFWANLPSNYPTSFTRHYFVAASASPTDEAQSYPGTLSLRRDLLGPESSPRWNFWTTGDEGAASRHDLAVADQLGPGWHHFAISWEQASGSKALYINGELAARVEGVILPTNVGEQLKLGQWLVGSTFGGMQLDDLLILDRVANAGEVAAWANGAPLLAAQPIRATTRELAIDANAVDREGPIAAVQLGVNGQFELPQAYYDSYRWELPNSEGEHTIGLRVFDTAGNTSTVSATVRFVLPPRGSAAIIARDETAIELQLYGEDADQPLEMQLSQFADFRDAVWRPFESRITWRWQSGLAQRIYIRLRDSEGLISTPLPLLSERLFIPLVRE